MPTCDQEYSAAEHQAAMHEMWERDMRFIEHVEFCECQALACPVCADWFYRHQPASMEEEEADAA